MNIEVYEGQLTDQNILDLIKLEELCFGQSRYDLDRFKKELSIKPGLLLYIAKDGDNLLGYKIGYQDKLGQFYSWLGGVAPQARKMGLASKLMELQHAKLKELGYKSVRTHTSNEFRAMLLLNIKTGFNVTGTYVNRSNQLRIILEKQLS